MNQQMYKVERFSSAVHTNTGFVPMDKNDKQRRIAASAVAPRKDHARGKQWVRPSFSKRSTLD